MLSFLRAQEDVLILSNNAQKALLFFDKSNINGIIEIKKKYCFVLSSRYKCIDTIECYNSMNSLVTTYSNYRPSSVLSSDISVEGICKSINKSIRMSRYIEPDQYCGLPNINSLFNNDRTINLFFPHTFLFKEIKDIVDTVNSSALRFNSQIINIDNSTFEYFINIKILGNSFGWIGTYLSTYYCLSSYTIANYKNIMERDFYYTVARDYNDLESPVDIGHRSAKRSFAKLNSRKISTQISPIIFASDISYELFNHLIDAIDGYAIYKKSTFLLNYLNKRIFPEWLNIFEDPFLQKGLSSFLFDNDGVATVRKKIVENGILKTWLLDTYTSKKLNLCNTGHSGGIYNWIVSSNKKIQSFKNLLYTMNRGFLITEILGDGVNILTGNYSRGACGFWIDYGMIQYPVHGFTISGNLIDIWNNMILISDDINYYNNIRSSSILIDKVQISGF